MTVFDGEKIWNFPKKWPFFRSLFFGRFLKKKKTIEDKTRERAVEVAKNLYKNGFCEIILGEVLEKVIFIKCLLFVYFVFLNIELIEYIC